MQARLGHHVRVGAQVGAREKFRVAGWLWVRAKQHDHRRHQWQTAAGGRVLGRARQKGREGFIGPVAHRGGFTPPSWPTVAPAWARRQLRRAVHRWTMADGGLPAGECTRAAWHQPRLLARIIGPSCTVVTARALDRWVLRRLDVSAWPGYGDADVAGAWCDVARSSPN
jgi:hypothetical protein